jgi:phage-related minor tail protein
MFDSKTGIIGGLLNLGGPGQSGSGFGGFLTAFFQSFMGGLGSGPVQLGGPGFVPRFANGGAFMSGLGLPYGVYNNPTYFAMPGQGQLKKFAQGGVLGEAGPEAIMPLKRDQHGRLGVEGGGTTVIVNNNVSGVDIRTTEGPDNTLTIDVIRKTLANDVKLGGNLFANSLSGTFGLNRINR